MTHQRQWRCTAAMVLMSVSAPIKVLACVAKRRGRWQRWGQQTDRLRRILVLIGLAASDPEGSSPSDCIPASALGKQGWTEERNIRMSRLGEVILLAVFKWTHDGQVEHQNKHSGSE